MPKASYIESLVLFQQAQCPGFILENARKISPANSSYQAFLTGMLNPKVHSRINEFIARGVKNGVCPIRVMGNIYGTFQHMHTDVLDEETCDHLVLHDY
ncbi:hypothetical protein [Pseudomonas sp. PS02302]|uniref:hypothetical protein n=1 Tax=Pseudomonas sp. PS02302 TaxID=2991428 RepID=UPI00249B2B29|nr:hypothetical protein [Pseudomonas sp. PS02302]